MTPAADRPARRGFLEACRELRAQDSPALETSPRVTDDMVNRMLRRAQAAPSGSLARRAAASACEALMRSATLDGARLLVAPVGDPEVRSAALALLDELAKSATTAADTEEIRERP